MWKFTTCKKLHFGQYHPCREPERASSMGMQAARKNCASNCSSLHVQAKHERSEYLVRMEGLRGCRNMNKISLTWVLCVDEYWYIRCTPLMELHIGRLIESLVSRF